MNISHDIYRVSIIYTVLLLLLHLSYVQFRFFFLLQMLTKKTKNPKTRTKKQNFSQFLLPYTVFYMFLFPTTLLELS